MSTSVPVLMFHHVSPNPGLVTVSPETFRLQMEQLHSAGYTTLRTAEFLAVMRGDQPLPARAVFITFDDGFLDNYVYAFPVLHRYGLHATIFTVTGWVADGPVRPCQGDADLASLPETPSHKQCKAAIREGRADQVMVRWSEIQKMQASGSIEIHSHTHSHIRWDQEFPEPGERIREVRHDLGKSQEALRSHLGHASEHLCWPWGYFEAPYQTAAAEAGFLVQYTTRKGPNRPGTDLRFIRRVVVKDRADRWLNTRLWIFRHAWLGEVYSRIQGRSSLNAA